MKYKLLADYKKTLDKGIESNNESLTKVYDTYSAIIASLQKELEKEDLSFEQKKYIIEQMKDIADKVDKKDTENRKFIALMASLASAAVLGTVAVIASALGGNTTIDTNDNDDSM